jgi:hypothetical protein
VFEAYYEEGRSDERGEALIHAYEIAFCGVGGDDDRNNDDHNVYTVLRAYDSV